MPDSGVVVWLDFGTTFSRFANAHVAGPEKIYACGDWPRPRPRSQVLHDLYIDFMSAEKNLSAKLAERTRLLTPPWFKLNRAMWGESSAGSLPMGNHKTEVIVDWLREMGADIIRHLHTKFSDDLTLESVQWCVTVPSIWDDHAKKQMKVCMARAGLIRSAQSPGGSPHPLIIVLEPEAAPCYAYRNMPDLHLVVGDRLLVADIGGGTTDIVVQECISETPDDFRVKEVTYTTVGLCGGTYVDEQFNRFLLAKIPCLRGQVLRKSSACMSEILKRWGETKCSFGDSVTVGESFEIQLPSQLASDWESFDTEHGNPPRSSYDALELTHADIEAIFNPVVEETLALIADQLSVTSNVKVIFVVGGFCGSPYLMTRIKERFLDTVEKVISPVQPGSAVCQGGGTTDIVVLEPEEATHACAKSFDSEVQAPARGDKFSNWVLQKIIKGGDIDGVNTGFGATSHSRTQQGVEIQSELIRIPSPTQNQLGTGDGSSILSPTQNEDKRIENVDTKLEAGPAVAPAIAPNPLVAKLEEDVLLEACKPIVTKLDSVGRSLASDEGPEGPECLNGTESDDEGLSDGSRATHESEAEGTADSPCLEPNANGAGRKRKGIEDDDLKTMLAPFIEQQVEAAVNSRLLHLVSAMRSREENEQRHREKMLALEEMNLALKREKFLFKRRRVARSQTSSSENKVGILEAERPSRDKSCTLILGAFRSSDCMPEGLSLNQTSWFDASLFLRVDGWLRGTITSYSIMYKICGSSRFVVC